MSRSGICGTRQGQDFYQIGLITVQDDYQTGLIIVQDCYQTESPKLQHLEKPIEKREQLGRNLDALAEAGSSLSSFTHQQKQLVL
jgi:hypothetical protein